ncbi:hypothetical protein Tco_0492399 [Tanacetum coccineum]
MELGLKPASSELQVKMDKKALIEQGIMSPNRAGKQAPIPRGTFYSLNKERMRRTFGGEASELIPFASWAQSCVVFPCQIKDLGLIPIHRHLSQSIYPFRILEPPTDRISMHAFFLSSPQPQSLGRSLFWAGIKKWNGKESQSRIHAQFKSAESISYASIFVLALSAGIAISPLSYYRCRDNLYQVQTIFDHQILRLQCAVGLPNAWLPQSSRMSSPMGTTA